MVWTTFNVKGFMYVNLLKPKNFNEGTDDPKLKMITPSQKYPSFLS